MMKLNRLKISLIQFVLFLSTLSLLNEDSFGENSHTVRSPEIVNIEVTTHLGDNQIFIEKDIISFFISLDKDAYLYVFYKTASGQVFQLVPGKVLSDHYFHASTFLSFPPPNSNFKFVVQPPYGDEQLWVFASEQKALSFMGKQTGQGIKLLQQKITELEDFIRTASIRMYGKASLAIQTQSK